MKSRQYGGTFEAIREERSMYPSRVKQARAAARFVMMFWRDRHIDEKLDAMIKQKREPFRHFRDDLYYSRYRT